MKKTITASLALAVLGGCGSAPKKAEVPALTPELGAELLHFDNKAETWLTFVKKNDPTCAYKLDLPDQASQPTEIDLDHIVWCNGRPSPKQYDASVILVFDKAAGKWAVSRFSS